jgi:hypothetical protein
MIIWLLLSINHSSTYVTASIGNAGDNNGNYREIMLVDG